MSTASGALAQASAADGPWSGEAQCVLSTRGPKYQEDQTHTWRLTGGPPRVAGSVRFWPAAWSVIGSGSSPSGSWTISVPDTSAPIAMYEVPGARGNNTLKIETQHLLVAPGAIKVKASSGKDQPPASFQEWAFPKIEVPMANTTIIGSGAPRTLTAMAAWGKPADASTTETCTWSFTRGGAASLQSTQSAATASPATTTPSVTLSSAGSVKPPAQVAIPPAGTTAGVAINTGLPPNVLTKTPPASPVADLASALLISSTSPATSAFSSFLVPGGTAALVLRVSNFGPGAADGAVVSLPAVTGVTPQSVVCPLASCPSVAQLQQGWPIPQLPAGATVAFTIQSAVAATVSSGLTLTARATPPSNVTDASTANNTSALTPTLVQRQSDLQVSLVSSLGGKTNVVTSFSYDVTVKTMGPISADGAVVAIPAVAGLRKIAVSCAFSERSKLGVATCPAVTSLQQIEQGVAIPILAPDDSVTFTVQVIATSSGTQTVSASATPPSLIPDPAPANNSATAMVPTTGVPPPGTSDLSVSVTASARPPTGGAPVIFVVIDVVNAGPGPVNFAAVRAPALAGTTATRFVCGGIPSPIGPSALCPFAPTASGLATGLEIPQLPANSRLQFRIDVIAPTSPGAMTVTATASMPPGGTDPNPANNSASATATVP